MADRSPDPSHSPVPSLPPLPEAGARWALFLDIDGTIADIAPTPDAVAIGAETRSLLARLAQGTGGALALVSGRSIGDIDRLFAPLRLPVAGLHGLERRAGDGTLSAAPAEPAALGPIRAALAAFAATHPGTVVEDKGPAVALHFRNAPEAEAEAEPLIAGLLANGADGVVLQRGKMVRELRAGGADKGRAIRAFMEEAPFRGRHPVFVGDDVTDEDGFVAVNAMGGVTVRVGNGQTAAAWRSASVAAIHNWLAEVARRLASGRDAAGSPAA